MVAGIAYVEELIDIEGTSESPSALLNPMHALEVRFERGDRRILDKYDDTWRELCAGSGYSDPFYQPEWSCVYLRYMEASAAVVMVTVVDSDRLVAVLPLVEEHVWDFGLPLTRWRAVTDRISPDRIDLVSTASERDFAAIAVWDALRRDDSWDLIEIANAPKGGGADVLAKLARLDGHPVSVGISRHTPVTVLNGVDADPLMHVSTKFRANLRRRRRNLERLGALDFVRVESADPNALDRFFRLEAAGWKGRSRSALASDSGQQRYYSAIAQDAANRGYFVLHSLEVDGHPVAMQFGLEREGKFLGLKIAHDESKREFAPGHLLTEEIMLDSARRGLREFDFLGESAPWKMEWASGVRTYLRVQIFADKPSSRLGHSLRHSVAPKGREAQRGVSAALRRLPRRRSANGKNGES